MKHLNNKGFAISTVIYGTFILFIMILAILLASITSSLRLLDDRVNVVNNYEIGDIISEPDIDNTNLVPVKYDMNKGAWVITTKDDEEWYDYSKRNWANAVALKKDIDDTEGTILYDLNSQVYGIFVWIPRFSYTISCDDEAKTNCYGYRLGDGTDTEILSKKLPGAIDIKFTSTKVKESGENKYYYDTEKEREPKEWKTHPAFTFGEKELSGIWVGKFETSVDLSSNCYGNKTENCEISKNDIRVLPNVKSLTNQKIFNQFNYSRYLTDEDADYKLIGDSHMTKLSEWSAVAYLSQSIYGKYGNSNYKNEYKEIYINSSYANVEVGDCFASGCIHYYTNSYITGISQGAPFFEDESKLLLYSYDDLTLVNDGQGYRGPGASTTGNIYGVYDMNGGVAEYVMSYINGNVPSTGGFLPEWFTNNDNKNYFNSFLNQNNDEIYKLFNDVTEWYNDRFYLDRLNGAWGIFGHKGLFREGNSIERGLFSYEHVAGESYIGGGFRIVIVGK